MGLFDIFRRRSKESDKKKQVEEPEQSAEQQAAQSTEKAQEDTDQPQNDNAEDSSKSTSVIEEATEPDTNKSDGDKSQNQSEENSTDSEVIIESEPEQPVKQDNNQTDNETDNSVDKSTISISQLTSVEQSQKPMSSETNLEQSELASTAQTDKNVTSVETDETPHKLNVDTGAADNATVTEESPVSNNGEQPIGHSEQPLKVSAEDQPEEPEQQEPISDVQVTNDEPENVAEQTEDKTTKYEHGLAKSRSTFGQRLNSLFANFRSVDEEFFEHLEDMLIESDVGFETAMRLTDELRDEVKLKNVKKSKDVQNVIVQKMIELYDAEGNGEDNSLHLAANGPSVLLFVGVNGVGKTTTIGKLAKRFKDEGKKVLLVAADTFRAGAIEQLNVWAKRDGVDIVKKEPGSDPAAAVFDGVKKAKAENYDILMVDTAGRLQNKVNLMNELAKMKKILTREIPNAPHEVLLVLDATTGQNAMTQAKTFKETTDVTGIVLTKLDGTAKGGIVLAIRNELHLPVKLVGLGEKVTDLADFDPNNFIYGLFKGLFKD